jgi:hypothetical protein
MTDPQALKAQLEAEALDMMKRSMRQPTAAEVDHMVAETLRRQGVPVVRAKHVTVGTEMVFDLAVATPRGSG